MNALMNAEIEATVDDQIANGVYGPEPDGYDGRVLRAPRRSARVKQLDEPVLPTPETVIVEGRKGFPEAPKIEINSGLDEHESFVKRAALLGIEVP